ncbi:Type II secretion system protein M [Vibrio aerogenes CECT 7868]|uniref:Type II secretion system protein M n=1 Tax=Vibrio aerogenes CECT 7868 TaxID=1216006 RepID=A0A1M5YUI7_9VIBR|nr:type II secretion system protein M [Vibrio aerogenes]SHI15737.1 Type II secretion system protein M [Vibrio aerogenes CECT 7868]
MNLWVSRCQSWWKSLSLREQKLVLIISIFAVVGAVYAGLIQPLQQQKAMAVSKLSSEQNLYNWVVSEANKITGLRGHGGFVSSDKPLNQLITNSTRQFGIRLIRIQPMSQTLQVWIEPLSFNQFIDWLTFLQEKYGIQVNVMDIERGKQEGMIEVKRLQLKRG